MLCPIFPKQILKKKKAIQVTFTGLINQSNCSNTNPALSVPQDSYTLKVCTYIYTPVQSLLIKFSAFKGEVPKLQRKFDLSSLLSVILKKKKSRFHPLVQEEKFNCYPTTFSNFIIRTPASFPHPNYCRTQNDKRLLQLYSSILQTLPSPAPNHPAFRKFLLCLPLM